jgi:hypothetical protein
MISVNPLHFFIDEPPILSMHEVLPYSQIIEVELKPPVIKHPKRLIGWDGSQLMIKYYGG